MNKTLASRSCRFFLFPMACLALSSFGCWRTDALGAAGQDDAGVDAHAPTGIVLQLPDSSTFSILPDSGTIPQKSGTCALLLPTARLHYPSEPNSPCPAIEPAQTSFACPDSLVGVQCAYPSPLSSDSMNIAACNAGPASNYWIFSEIICRRTGDDCVYNGAPSLVGLAPIQIASSCDSRSVVSCPVVANNTAQIALDNVVEGLATQCLDSGLTAGTVPATINSAALSVWFNGDCPTSFVVSPPELADCVKAQLEAERFDCAVGLQCGAGPAFVGCQIC
jgi:hypothetical protein